MMPRPRLIARPQIDMMLDSGAYSAWKLGKPIDRVRYCDYLLDNSDWARTIVALDVINPNDPEAAAAASYDNWIYMNGRGIKSIPVFHARESLDWLDRYLDAGCDYIGISASSLRGGSKADDWYAMVWDHLADQSGWPTVKTHAFGEGRERALIRFPWYSADSTSWVYVSQRNAQIHVGDRMVSARNDGASNRSQQNVGTLDDADMAAFHELLANSGVRPDAMELLGRDAVTIRTYLAACHYLHMLFRVDLACPIRHRSSYIYYKFRNAPRVEIPNLKFYLVAGNNASAWSALVHAEHYAVLNSYYYIDKSAHFRSIRDFVLDPIATCDQVEPMRTSMQILKDYSNAAD
jgi:hypothetical protein